jgi:hypothetical protein
LLERYDKRYILLWLLLDYAREQRGHTIPPWPAPVFAPLAVVAQTTEKLLEETGELEQPLKNNPQLIADIPILAALAGWREVQWIFRFEKTLYTELTQAASLGEMPFRLLLQVPQWSIYVETPGLHIGDTPLRGFYAHLDWHPMAQLDEVRLLLDTDAALVSIPLRDYGSLEQAMAAEDERIKQGAISYRELPEITALCRQITAATLRPVVNLLLFLCVAYAAAERPSRAPGADSEPPMQRVTPAAEPRIWQVTKHCIEVWRADRFH